MSDKNTPRLFDILISNKYIEESDILKTSDGFFMVYKSISDMLLEKDIVYFMDSHGKRQACNRFYDDWFLYAVSNETDYTYSLLKLREQEYDAEEDIPADGDTPGVTISFIELDYDVLLTCLENPIDENRNKLNVEINRVVAYKGQSHHMLLKDYFKNPKSCGSYLVATMYAKHIASYAEDGYLTVPECYKEIVEKSRGKRLPQFIESLNKKSSELVCDHKKIFIKDKENLSIYECLAILATHTGNTSMYSFAAEVEYHARFLVSWAKFKIPFLKRSIYDSAIRADMTIGETTLEKVLPFYQSESKIVKRQYELHRNDFDEKGDLI